MLKTPGRFMQCWASLLVLAVLGGCATGATPPVAMRRPVTVNLGGQPVTDDYWWLRNKDDPKVIDYLNAENAYTETVLKPTEPLRKKLYNEMLGRILETDESVPYRLGDWWYSFRTEKGKAYPIYIRRKGSPRSRPMVVADVNTMAEGHNYFDYSSSEPSPDGNLLAYTTDITGNRQYVLQVKDLRTGELLPDKVLTVDSYTWMADNHTLYYVKEDDSKRGSRLYRHALGTPVDKDDLVFEEKDAEFSIDVSHTRDREFIICQSSSKTQSEVRVLPADRPAAPVVVEPRRADLEYYVDHRPGRFYIRTNDTSRNFRIVTTPDDAPGKKNWTELLAADPGIVIGDFDVFAHNLVLTERRGGLPRLAIAALPDDAGDPAATGELKPKEIPFDEPDFDVRLEQNPEFDPPAVRFSYTSLTTPTTIFDYNPADGAKKQLKRQYAGDHFNPANYREVRLYADASDGTKIPISLVYRKDATPTTGPQAVPSGPLLLEGYGSYGLPSDVYFSGTRLSLLDRGVICATAHVRGGGEFGRAWYDAGRMENKNNTFSDFIAAAKYLESAGWTTPKEMAIEGASAGGLLIGAVVNRAPELFRAAIADVPWVDVLADMSDPSIPLTTVEYQEWGNPNVPRERAAIAGYDPYTNVHPQAYPDLLVRESLNDSQVQYWDAARWVAKLRAAKAKAGPAGESQLLLKMDMDAGHSGASGLYSELRDTALDDAWLLVRLGVEK